MFDMYKMAKESFPVNILVALILGIVLGYFIAVFAAGSSGKAIEIPTQDVLLEQIKLALPQVEIIANMGDFNACLIVNMPTEKFSFDVVKANGAYSINIADSWLCHGTENEDFIISYVSYGRFATHLSKVPNTLALVSANSRNFYIYPSKQIAEGFTLKNKDEFNSRFSSLSGLSQ